MPNMSRPCLMWFCQVSIALSADYEISNLGQEATVATWREFFMTFWHRERGSGPVGSPRKRVNTETTRNHLRLEVPFPFRVLRKKWGSTFCFTKVFFWGNLLPLHLLLPGIFLKKNCETCYRCYLATNGWTFEADISPWKVWWFFPGKKKKQRFFRALLWKGLSWWNKKSRTFLFHLW